jgi:hypothetical protein
VQALDLALLVQRVRGRRVDVDTKRQRGLLDRGGGDLQAVIPAQPRGKATERTPRRVDQDRMAQSGVHFGRPGLQRDRPPHDRARVVVEEQRHPRTPGAPSPGRHDEHRKLLVVALPDRVAVRRLIAQVQAVLAAAGLAAARSAGASSRAKAACNVRSGGGSKPRSRASRHTAATLPPRRR